MSTLLAVLLLTAQQEPLRFVAIGDYGEDTNAAEADVAALVKRLAPDLIITLGDNNYPIGGADTIDKNVGQHYHEFIHPYKGEYGEGAGENRFFPSPGNHDWYTPGLVPYLEWFELPGNERYYDFVRGPVHFFAVDSDRNEPDGFTADSVQGQWLREALARSESPFKIVYMHHPGYSSADHGNDPALQWPYAEWGASAVLAGHDHVYERMTIDGLPYFTNGLGGRSIYRFKDPIRGSQARFNQDYGAMLIEATASTATFRFVARSGFVVDTFTITPAGLSDLYAPIVRAGSGWRYLDDGSDPGASWTAPEFADGGWASGAAPLGYGDEGLATVIGFGPDEERKVITSRFRHVFEVADPAAFDELLVRLRRDDGGIVHLNGTEVFRSNMPSGEVTPSTAAESAVATEAEHAFYEASADAALLVQGRNVLAVEIHQSGTDSSDVAFDLALSGRTVPPPIVPRGSTWRYFAGWEPDAGWRLPSFDDSDWTEGPAEFGYGDGDEATVIDHGEADTRPLTTWFRHAFEVEDASAHRALLLRILRDDGAVAYLNGVEVYRFNLPLGEIGPATPAGLQMRGQRERELLETSIDPALLVDGRNLLAVEIHQRRPESMDMSFDLELVGLP